LDDEKLLKKVMSDNFRPVAQPQGRIPDIGYECSIMMRLDGIDIVGREPIRISAVDSRQKADLKIPRSQIECASWEQE
jgi:hypothetical protein